MRRTLLPLLLASLAFASLIFLPDGAAMKVMSAPNVLRVGAEENIFVECQDCPDENLQVKIKVMNHPTRTKTLAMTTVDLTRANNFQTFGKITVPLKDFSMDPTVKHYVDLLAEFKDIILERVVLVSFQSGYIFIQTDKTIYTPNTKVYYRVFAVTPQMKAVERNEQTRNEPSVIIDFVTPDNIVLPGFPVSPKSGIHSGDFKLPEPASTGLWKVVAKFQSNPQQSFSAQFEVKEYVLPSFEVKLTPEKTYFYVDDDSLSVTINAKYLFGTKVVGTAYVVFGIMQDNEKTGLPASLQRVSVKNGVGKATLRKEHITAAFQTINELVGRSIFVSVSVLTESGSEMVEAELRGIKIVTSPYTIHFRHTPQYFKPGMSFDVTVEVLTPDESPAAKIKVVINPDDENGDTVSGFTGANGVARLAINTARTDKELQVVAKTNDQNILPERQASASMTALPYITKTSNYIHISVGTAELKLGDDLRINLNFDTQPAEGKNITILILSKGQLVKHYRHKLKGNVLIVKTIRIEKEMLPSFRIVAYYHPNDEEVVSDSVWVDVKDSCMGSLNLKRDTTDSTGTLKPRDSFNLIVTGDPEATVGLVAVDKGVYVLNNKLRLTQKKIWDFVEKSDTGCTAGGGNFSMGVFYDAGLLFETDMTLETPGTRDRTEMKCPSATPLRQKRASTIRDVTISLRSKYKGHKTLSECCLDGMRDIPVSYTCERRSTYIQDGPTCVEAFLDCCKQMTTLRRDLKEENLKLARSDDDDKYMDSDMIVTRTKFPESWLWSDVTLPACSSNSPNCPTTSISRVVPLPDSITSWQFTGISLSKTKGICVGEPLEVIVKKDFFIDLKLPYSAVRQEQIEIRAILHNYSGETISVQLDLMETPDVCSAASKRGKYCQEVKVAAGVQLSVPFIIIPMKEGRFPIEVKGVDSSRNLNDGIMKTMRVVSQGVLVKTQQIVALNPAKNGTDGKQEEIINSRIRTTDLVPNSPTKTFISLTGREGAFVENVLSGKSMETLIYQPTGCGEQNMIHMTLPVIATVYLDKTNQWEHVGFDKRKEALKHIKTGYENQLGFHKKKDGSFSAFPDRDSSAWLTAYVAKVFSMAENLIAVDKEVICDAIKYLILKAKQSDGMFREVEEVIHGEMIGGIKSSDSNVSMTAFALIAMQESRGLCHATVNSLAKSIEDAVSYLEERMSNLTNPYAVAMASYALANEGKLNREVLFKFISPELSHWPAPRGHQSTLEATAYALLALVKTEAFEDARPVVRWFTKQQFVGGGYGSTQSTIMVYQAVSEYWAAAKESDYHLEVDIQLPGRTLPNVYILTRDSNGTRSLKFNDINQDVKVVASGSGEATLKMVSLYYVRAKESESDCGKFNMTVELVPVKQTEDKSTYMLTIKVLYKEKVPSTMTILDIGLLTGFTADTQDLDALSKGKAPIIAKYEMNTVLSERGSLIIYLEKVSHSQPDEVSFRVHQTYKVGVLQPAAVSVYEYYEQTRCVKFYHPEKRDGQLLQLCRNETCRCAEENCSKQKKENVSNEKRAEKLCESTPVNIIEYGYKVTVEGIANNLDTDIYSMRVTQIIKEGSIDADAQGSLRFFISHQHCRNALDLKQDKTYLIVGSAKDIYVDDSGKIYEYMLGERTWVEYWPTAAECETSEHRETCLGIEKMIHDFTKSPCKN